MVGCMCLRVLCVCTFGHHFYILFVPEEDVARDVAQPK